MFANIEKITTFAGALAALSLTLCGCEFGTSDDRRSCKDGACDCQNDYYGMEANVYLSGVPVEHASFHITVPRVEPYTDNSTGCCQAIFPLNPVHQPNQRPLPSDDVVQEFCDKCVGAPNPEIAKAAKTCAGSAVLSLGSVSPPASGLATPDLTSSDRPLAGSQDYADCKVEIDGISVPLVHGMNVSSGIVSSFNLKWTDLKSSSDKACCAALSPVLRSLYFGSGTPDSRQLELFCDACKTAYNPGVGLAAFRSCNNSAPLKQEGSREPARSSAAVAVRVLV